MKTLITTSLILLCLTSFAQLSKPDSIWIAKGKTELKASTYDPKVFDVKYRVVRIDEHEIQLISKKDTVILYLENSYQFREKIVFIKKK